MKSHIDDERLIHRICRKIESGIHPVTAARACGVTQSTFYNWLSLAEEKPDSKYGRAAAAFSQADARAEITIASHLIEAAKDDWKAAEAVLKRRFAHWGDRQTTRVETPAVDNAPVDIARQLAEAGVIDGIARILEAARTDAPALPHNPPTEDI